jgi:hypothetical protein
MSIAEKDAPDGMRGKIGEDTYGDSGLCPQGEKMHNQSKK